MFWQLAVGGIVSETVTVDSQKSVLSLKSVTVKVTVFPPISEQINSELSTVIDLSPQPYVDPLLISDESIETDPAESK